MSKTSGKRDRWLLAIAALKLAKGSLLLALAAGLLDVVHRDVGEVLVHWAHLFKVDPHNHYFASVVAKISGLDPRDRALVGAATFAYAALFLTEGVGLLLQQHWAEYLTIIATTSFIPIEIYEVSREASASRIALLIVNILVVGVLIWRLRRDKKR